MARALGRSYCFTCGTRYVVEKLNFEFENCGVVLGLSVYRYSVVEHQDVDASDFKAHVCAQVQRSCALEPRIER